MSKAKEKKTQNIILRADDDDIIYVPPPPQEVINVDEIEDDNICENISERTDKDETRNEHQNNENVHKATELPNTSESSNDFLENTNVINSPNNFNFSLHGSDFNNGNQSGFVQPNNPNQPNDLCETESSTTCSNDHSREFNNSVKTVVFSEVEFPKGDIFSENNLETFGSLIIPKRISKSNITTNKSIKDDTIELNSSDDEQLNPFIKIPMKCNKTLPNLSHMPLDEKNISINKRSKSLKLCVEGSKFENRMKKKSGKKKKKNLTKEMVVNVDLPIDKSTLSEIDRNKYLNVNEANFDLIKNKQSKNCLKVLDCCDQNVAVKRKQKCFENASISEINELNGKDDIKVTKQSLSNSSNIDNGSLVLDEMKSVQSDELVAITPKEVRDDFNISNIIIIDEISDSDSDLEIIETPSCKAEELNITDLQLVNCQKNKLLEKSEDKFKIGTSFDIQMIQNTQSGKHAYI